MSQTVITAAFEEWKAQEAAGGNRVVLDGFVLANVPGLDPDTPISNTEGMPPDSQIVYRQDVDKCGVVNNNAVVYSITLGSNIGTFDFNWIGLVNKASGVLAMIVHTPIQRKLKTEDGQQGNAINRSFLMEYDGAAQETQINTPAQTWQIDFTARLSGMDEEWRMANFDIYGPGAFFGDGFLVKKDGSKYQVQPGNGYIGGVRATLSASEEITAATLPAKVFADVSWQGALTGRWQAVTTVQSSTAELADYIDGNGFAHYVFAVASIDATGVVTDLRPIGSIPAQVADGAVKSVNTHKPDEHGNVKLGTAADADVTTSQTDTTAGRVMRTGDGGMLGTVVRLKNTDLLNKDGCPSSLFGQGNAQGSDDHFSSYGVGIHLQYGLDGGGSKMLGANLFIDPAGNLTVEWLEVVKVDGSVAVQKKQKLFGPLNPDTSRVAKAGDEMTGALTAPGFINKGDYSLRNLANRHIRFEYLKNDGTWAVDAYIYKDGVDAPNRRPGVRINCGTPNKDKGNTSNSGDWVFGEDGMLSCPGEITGAYKGTFMWNDQYNTKAPFYHDFTTAGTSEYHPLIKQRARLSSNAWVFTQGVLISGVDLTWHLYMRGSAGQDIHHYWDTKGNYYCPGQVVPGNYTNFDSRYLGKSSTLTRLGAQVVVDVPNHQTVNAPAGCVQSAVRCGSDGALTGMGYRPLQILVNGTWVNVQSL
ncbi:phage tail protein [Enterobacter ludwigii]|uniref:phage tail-collar fiber domain-containing protein n=1 Tax=Enterobacter ludwigii TaxID=299767 RepID=UPI0030764F80